MSVVFYSADVTAIRQVQDRLANVLASSKGPWNLQARFFRSNPASFRERPAEIIYTVTSSDAPNKVNLFTNSQALVSDDSILAILTSKLQSLWTTRQTFRVEGEAFEWNGLSIKVGNAFLQGTFKGLVAQISPLNELATEEAREKIVEAISTLGLKGAADDVASGNVELMRQYSKLNR